MNIEATKQQLNARKKLLEIRLHKAERDASHRDQAVSADFAEQATERENDEVLDAIGHEAEHELTLIKKALKRIAEDRYPECDGCGATISSQRLQAVPFADLCIGCAEQEEQNLQR